MDKRWEQLGDLLVNYSAAVKPGERVMIAFVETETYPLVHAVYKACVKAGAYPQVQFLSEELNRLLLKYGNEDQIGWEPEIEAYGMSWADVYFGLRGAHNLDVFWDISADKLALLRKAMGKISTLRWQKTRWCLVRVPILRLPVRQKWMRKQLRICSSTHVSWTGNLSAKQWQNWAKNS